MSTSILFWSLAALAFIGGTLVVTTRDVSKLALGLGAFLLAVAGFFALFGFGFLALAELFVYVGGVLILLLFAIMLVHRSSTGSPSLEVRHDLLAAVSCLGIFGFALVAFRPAIETPSLATGAGPEKLGAVLLTKMLPQFELAGLLLLAALVAVVAVSGGDRE